MTTISFDADGNKIMLTRKTPSRLPLGKPSAELVPFADWVISRPARAAAAVARMLKAVEDVEVAPDGAQMVTAGVDAATLHPAFVARLTDSEAQALGLPPATLLTLNLRSRGLIHKDGFHIDADWSRPGGVPVMAKVANGRLRHAGADWRIPEPLYSALIEVGAVNTATDEAARQAAIAGLKRVIGIDAAAKIATDGNIERLRLAYASGFSLALKTSAAGFDFDPVLFGRERLDTAIEGAVLDEDEDGLLPPRLAVSFARRFRAGDGARRTYLLDDGSILYIDPQLSRVLTEVRRAQAGGSEARRAFATAPARHIAEALCAVGEEPGDATQLFIETQQFSERVAGIDIWRKPVLPWVKPKPNSWLPECFGLRIGEGDEARTIEIPPERIIDASTAARQAVREQRAAFTFDGETIPATQATVSALDDLAALSSATGLQNEGDEASKPPASLQRYFLQIRDNLEDVIYAPIGAPEIVAEISPPQFPVTMRSAPKPHQITGFNWLAACWRAHLPGALLADDMGLGKTYQALAFLAWLREQQVHPKPVLIVAPTGLLANWRAEIDRHLEPGVLGRVVGAYGRELAQIRAGAGRDIDTGDSALDPAGWAHAGVVLTTYETMRDYHMSFARQPFAAILYDEAQKLKNPASQITRGAKTLNAAFQLALTGTPVENRLQDLWSIFDVVHPGLLGSSKAFEQAYPADPERLQVLNERLTQPQQARPAVLLRRLKEECLGSLPAKIVQALPLPMPAAQAAAYSRVVHKALAVKGTGQRGRMLEILAQLRGVSLHPVAPDEAGDDPGYWDDSARLRTLFTVLDAIAAKSEKALIFCESLAMQALLAAEIRRRYKLPNAVARIHGGVAGDARQAEVDAFQRRPAGFDAMILSPKAGGVGLTLTAANHVIHLSRWWNPAVEDQATDRAYRIGQERDVTVYLPQAVHPEPALAETSFDLKLHSLMERKRALSRGLFAPVEEESDANALFEAVVSERDGKNEDPESATSPVEPSPAPAAAEQRRVLSLRREVPSPTTPPTPAARYPRRVVYQANGARDLTIFTAPIADDPVRELIIIDPYAAADNRSRDAVAGFARLLLGDGAGADPVRLITYDADSIDLRAPESNDDQYADMHDRWRHAFGERVGLQFFQQSRRANRSLHDREVRATTRSGRTLIWDLGRGIDGVMRNRHKCNVTLTEE